MYQLFEEQVERSPDAIAVVYGGRRLTYQDLNRRANRLARYLKRLGVGPEVLVGISVNRSEEMVVGLLGILKAGGAYLPLDPAYPESRVEFMLIDAKAAITVTTSDLLSRLPKLEGCTICLDIESEAISREDGANLDENVAPENLAYVIYTSGSTGRPKGVQIPHRAILNLLTAMCLEPGMKCTDVLLAVTTLSFDIANLEIFLPLAVGARVVVASREAAMDGHQLKALLESSGGTVMQATPATWRMLLEAGWKSNREFKVLCGGEGLPLDLARDLLKRSGSLWNLYGPTETTVWSMAGEVSAKDKSITIGRPIANTQVYLLNKEGLPVPVGATGELYIGGDGMARGYLGWPDLTAQRFVANPFEAGTRLYRTGDLARCSSDGRLECLGRIDRQVKLRGYRIEIGEIETVLREHSAVRHAVAMVREDIPGDQRLVAYLVLRSGWTEGTGQILTHLRGRLPQYMIPSFVIPLEALPLTSNGKIDYRALPKVSGIELNSPVGYVAPRDQTERELTKIWEDLLHVRRIGIKDNFFDLGGHSLLAIRLISLVEKELGKSFSLANIFRSPTIEGLAEELRGEEDTTNHTLLVPFRTQGTRLPAFLHGASFELSRHLGEDQPCYGLEPHGQNGKRAPETVEEMAADCLRQIRSVQAQGPYVIGGYSFGGLVAYEMAQQLLLSQQEVGLLVLIDPIPPNGTNLENSLQEILSSPDSTFSRHMRKMKQLDLKGKVHYFLAGLMSKKEYLIKELKMLVCCAYLAAGRRIPSGLRMFYFFETSAKATEKYKASPYEGSVVLLESQSAGSQSVWRELVSGELKIHQMPGNHLDPIIGAQVEVWGNRLKESLLHVGEHAESYRLPRDSTSHCGSNGIDKA